MGEDDGVVVRLNTYSGDDQEVVLFGICWRWHSLACCVALLGSDIA
jgi:hypothetical protein